MNRREFHVLEIIWLVLALTGLFAGIYHWFRLGIQEALMFFIIAALATMMYFFRRNLRKSKKR
jgi:hypothetical protein